MKSKIEPMKSKNTAWRGTKYIRRSSNRLRKG